MRLRLGIALAGAIVAASVASATTSAAGSATSELAAIQSAGRAQKSVHYVIAGTSAGAPTGTLVGDVGTKGGIQQITVRSGGRVGHVTVVVANNTAYVRADAYSLVNYMGFRAPGASKYSQRWVSIPFSNGAYSTIAAAVTLPSIIGELAVPGSLSLVPQTQVDGQRVIGVRGVQRSGGANIPTTLYARAKGSPLPVEKIASLGNKRATITLSRWNERLSVSAPSGAVPISRTGLE